jgi:hypothetical protein
MMHENEGKAMNDTSFWNELLPVWNKSKRCKTYCQPNLMQR